ncbi:MAG: aminopeptidase P N-terminal domain-containing protein [Dehalococcoidia bacterium]|nr:aminopeptidase P N-terminal domain-containing protein [Dehalococcoidia bacterium]
MADEFKQRRDRLMRRLGKDSAAVFVSGHETLRNGDVDYPFRQDSTFFYLTGFEEPASVAVLRPGADKPYTLIVRPHDPQMAVWVGPRAGVDGAVERYGADQAFPIEELEDRLRELLDGVSTLWFSVGGTTRTETLLTALVASRRAMSQRGATPIEAIRDPEPLVDEMRLLKSPSEVRSLQRAIDVTGKGLEVAMRATRPGMHEYEVQAILEQTYRAEGAVRDGFPTIAASGPNSCTLHYTTNRRQLRDGDLMLLDTGAEWDYYAADVTRTFPANGRFTGAQRAVYDVVLEAQRNGIERAKPGLSFHDAHDAAVRTLVEGLIDLKVLKGDVDSLIERDAYRHVYMHSTSHWLGLDVHDAGRYREDGKSLPLRPGMVLTVEPGLYFAPGTKGVPKRLQGIGIRIEDDILVTKNGNRNLSGKIPSAPDDLEAIVGTR